MRQAKRYSIEQFMKTIKVSGASFSHDEKSILFTSDQTGISNAYAVPITGGTPRQLTFSTAESIQALSYFPQDNRILFARDYGNIENSHLCVLEEDGRETLLTPGERVQAYVWAWSADKKSFYCSTNERDERFFDLYKIDAAGYARTLLYQGNANYQYCDVSRDERYVLLVKFDSRMDSNLYLYDTSSKEMQCLTPHKGDSIYCLGCFVPNSQYVYYITDRDSEFRHVERRDLATGRVECVERADGDVGWTFFSPNAKYRITLISEHAGLGMGFKVYDQVSCSQVELSNIPRGNITSAGVSESERLMAFYVDGDRAPGNIHIYDFATQQTSKLTESLNPEIDPEDMVESEMVSYRSFDGLEIPCLLWKPHGSKAGDKAPALIWAHGGPGGRTVKGYKGRIQYLVNHGYVVLGVNYRGSSGFGKTFFAADERKHGREPLWDCVEAKKYLGSLGYVDVSRVGIIGASFGGYMALAGLAFQPEEFAVGVNICGISNWLKFIDSIPPHWDANITYQKLGNPRTDRELLRAMSPYFHAERIVKPLMILQGAKDPRCPKDQTDEMVEAIRKNGGTVEYLVFEDEAHGFRKQANAIIAYEAILRFLDRHLR